MAHMSESLQTIIRILIIPIQVIETLDRDKTRKSCDQITFFLFGLFLHSTWFEAMF